MKKLTLFSILAIALLVCGCNKGETDPRDAYTGTWQLTNIGSITGYYNGEAIFTQPHNQTGSVVISKSGQSGLNISGTTFFLNDNRLTADPESINTSGDGIQMVGTAVYSGQASDNLIVITTTITGSWSGQGASGNMSGSATWTLTR